MILSALVASALQAAQPAQRPPDLFDLMEGEWVCRQEMLASGPVWRTETWSSQEDDSVAGRVQTSSRRLGSGEAMRPDVDLLFSRRGRVPRLTYRAAGGRPVHYRLARATRQEAVFEVVGSGSPRIISYRVSSFRQLDVMFGLEDGSSQRWSYQPPGMHTAIIDCDGRRR